jgi:hypothetical protein
MRARLREALEKHREILFALLFGSRATGRERADSDWDVGVYVEGGLGANERFRLRLTLQAELDALGRMDVVILNDAPPLLAARALQGERLLVRDRTAYVRFFVRTLALAGDEAYWRRIHAEARARRLREGRFGRP